MKELMAQSNLDESDALMLSILAGQVFKPAVPIITRDLFAGRLQQLKDVLDVVGQVGQHAVIYGEPGVGKTSLANIVSLMIENIHPGKFVCTNLSATTYDSFTSLWAKAFREVVFTKTEERFGFAQTDVVKPTDLTEATKLSNDPSPDEIRHKLAAVGDTVFIFDEFNCLKPQVVKSFTDLIKMLSDYFVPSTIIIVGVASTLKEIIKDHASIRRGLVEVKMPRMNAEELCEILTRAEKNLNITFSGKTKQQIAAISNGLPFYTHLLGLHSTRAACARRTRLIVEDDVFAGATEAIRKGDFTFREKYDKAVHSANKNALHRQVLLAAAFTPTNEFGFFQPSDVAEPLSKILNRPMVHANYQKHLTEFILNRRGAVLEPTGQPYKKRFRFRDPMLPPFIIINAMSSGLITKELGQALIGSRFQD